MRLNGAKNSQLYTHQALSAAGSGPGTACNVKIRKGLSDSATPAR